MDLALPDAGGPAGRAQPAQPFFLRLLGRGLDAEGPCADVPIRLAGRPVTGAAHPPDPGRPLPEEELAESGVVSDPANHHLPDRSRSATCESLHELLANQRPPGPSVMLPPPRALEPRPPRPLAGPPRGPVAVGVLFSPRSLS